MKYKKYKYGVVINYIQNPTKNFEYQFVIIEDNISYTYNLHTGETSVIPSNEYSFEDFDFDLTNNTKTVATQDIETESENEE
jgi:hypothetical protein